MSHLFHVRTETGNGSRVGHVSAMLLGVRFAIRHHRTVVANRFIKISLLSFGQIGLVQLHGRETLCLWLVRFYVR